MISYDKSSLITFNGEIYNYKELKNFLLLNDLSLIATQIQKFY